MRRQLAETCDNHRIDHAAPCLDDDEDDDDDDEDAVDDEERKQSETSLAPRNSQLNLSQPVRLCLTGDFQGRILMMSRKQKITTPNLGPAQHQDSNSNMPTVFLFPIICY